MKEELSKRFKKKALDLGADVVGVAGKKGFDQAPEGHRPEEDPGGSVSLEWLIIKRGIKVERERVIL